MVSRSKVLVWRILEVGVRARVWVMLASVSVVGAGGYAWADAYDHVPGILTVAPPPDPPADFLVADQPLTEPPPVPPVSVIDGDPPVPDPAEVQRLAQRVVDDPRTGRTGVLIVDIATGEVLGSVNADAPRVPASTAKTLTAIAALHGLGADYTTVTSVTWNADTSTLALAAGGDMLLTADYGHAGERHDARGWAGLADLADLVVESIGQPSQPVTVVVDDTAFPGPAYPVEWPAYARQRGFASPVTGLAVNAGRVTDDNYSQRHADPSVAAGNDFAEQLRERGFTVTAVRRGQSAQGAVVVAKVESAPLSLVCEYLLHVSDNTVSEIVARVLARETGRPVTPEGASRATIAQLDDLGVDTTGLVLYDGAGFSTRNRVAPSHLVDAMARARDSSEAKHILDYLPLGGVEGTVGGRYDETAAAGVVRAKTGGLTGVTALAGAVQTGEGRWLWFAVMSDGMPFGQDRPQAATDVLVRTLSQWGCEHSRCVLDPESE